MANTYFLSWGSTWDNSSEEYNKDTMTYLTTRQRAIFFAIFLLLFLTAILGNFAAIVTTYGRKHRYIQKTLIISLALSDLIMASAYAIEYLEAFSHALLNWTMGEAMCYIIPFLQTLGVSASAGAIVIIALDRYRTAVHATMRRWNPNLWMCLFGVSMLWALAAGLAYPAWILLLHKKVIIVSEDEYGNVEYEEGYICRIKSRTNLLTYYIGVVIAIFVPLVIVICWLQYNIIKLVCKTRKSLNNSYSITNKQNNTESNSDMHMTPTNGTRSILKKSSIMLSKRSFHVQRRIRIFKIMIFLLMAFLLCRSPHWIFSIIKTSRENSDNYWIPTFLLSALALSDCILNPFLYTFLPQTMSKLSQIWKTFSDFTCEVCCCCCSNTEFEQFERENPFSVESYEKNYNQNLNQPFNKTQKVKFEDKTIDQHARNRKY